MNVAYGLLMERSDEDTRTEVEARSRPDTTVDETGFTGDLTVRAERMAQAFGGDGELVIVDV